jgi:uncharacterized protein
MQRVGDQATDGYLPRIVDDELDELLVGVPAVSIEGAKGVGKTHTALQRANTTFRFESPASLAVASADPSRITAAAAPVLIDEWQRLPHSWDVVRRSVDDGAPPGSYLLTGSASRSDISTHSGAGRIVTVRMRPLSLAERQIDQPTVSMAALLTGAKPVLTGSTTVDLERYVQEIVTGGFPGLRTSTGRAQRARLDGYIDRIIDRDIVEFGRPNRNPATLRRWLAAYGAAVSTSATYEVIRDAATPGISDKPAKSTTIHYRDALERLWILDPVPAWLPTRNPLARLSTPDKHHLVDPALAARLLGIDASALLGGRGTEPLTPRDGTMLGNLFESLITQSIRVYAQAAECRVHHLRTRGGQREIDLIVERADHRVVAIEIKLTNAADDRDLRHLRWLRNEIGDDLLDAIVVTTGADAYRTADGIAVVPAALLGP